MIVCYLLVTKLLEKVKHLLLLLWFEAHFPTIVAVICRAAAQKSHHPEAEHSGMAGRHVGECVTEAPCGGDKAQPKEIVAHAVFQGIGIDGMSRSLRSGKVLGGGEMHALVAAWAHAVETICPLLGEESFACCLF